MEKFTPYEKLSKKARRALDARKRGSWGGLNPVTRKPANPRAYDRNKAKRWKYDDSPSSPCIFQPYMPGDTGRAKSPGKAFAVTGELTNRNPP